MCYVLVSSFGIFAPQLAVALSLMMSRLFFLSPNFARFSLSLSLTRRSISLKAFLIYTLILTSTQSK